MKWATRIIFVVAWLLWAVVAYKLLLPVTQPTTRTDLIEEAFQPSSIEINL